MKKLLTLALVGAMFTACSITAFAVDYPGGTQDTEITTSVAPAFTVTIPADTTVPFNSLNTDFGSVTLESARLAPNKAVAVDVSSDFTLKNNTDNQEIIPYTVTTFADGTTDVMEIKGNTLYFDEAGDSYDLTINIRQVAWDAAAAGDYSDTVTFNISYVDADE